VNRRSNSPLALAAVATTAVLWGTTGTAATFAPGVGPLAAGAAALGIGGILQAVVAFPELRRRFGGLLGHRGLVVAGAVAVFTYPLAFYSSMHLAGVAVGTVVSLGSAPLFAGLIEWMTTGRAPSARWFASVVVGVVGAVLISTATAPTGAEGSASTVPGLLLGLLAGASYAAYSWVASRLMGAGVGRGAAMGSVFGLGGVLLMPVLVVTGAPILDSVQNMTVAAYMALIPMFLGYVLFGYGLTRLRPSTATTVTLLEPAVAAALAVFVVGEQLSGAGWTGVALIGGSLVILGAPSPMRRGRRSGRRSGRYDAAPGPVGRPSRP
jgi:DME family drug/metabolite transporter